MATYLANSVSITELDLDGLPVALAALIDGAKWGAGGYGTRASLTYSFPWTDGQAYAAPGYGDGEWNAGTFELNAAERGAVARVLRDVARGADITFTRVPDNAGTVGELRFTGTHQDTYAHAWVPFGDFPDSGDVWFGPDWFIRPDPDVLAAGSYEYMTIVHEVGHALGLRHPFREAGDPVDLPVLPPELDNYLWTAMSYVAHAGAGQEVYADFYPTTLMYLDLVALEEMYGPSASANPGPTTYTFYSSKQYWQTINDSSGVDTIVYVSPASGGFIDLSNEQFSRMGRAVHFSDDTFTRDTIGFGPSTIIENATGGGGNDTLIGNGAANRLIGNGGNDQLVGAAGNDNLVGGPGADRLFAGAGNDRLAWQAQDTLVDGGPGQADMLKLPGSLNLTGIAQGRIINIERIDMTGGGANTLTLTGADVLDLSTTTNQLRVLGDAQDRVNIVGTFATGATSAGYTTYTIGAATLLVDSDITVV